MCQNQSVIKGQSVEFDFFVVYSPKDQHLKKAEVPLSGVNVFLHA